MGYGRAVTHYAGADADPSLEGVENSSKQQANRAINAREYFESF